MFMTMTMTMTVIMTDYYAWCLTAPGGSAEVPGSAVGSATLLIVINGDSTIKNVIETPVLYCCAGLLILK